MAGGDGVGGGAVFVVDKAMDGLVSIGVEVRLRLTFLNAMEVMPRG